MADVPVEENLAERLFISVGALGHTGLLARPNASKGEMSVLGTLNAAGRPLSPSTLASLTNVTTSRTANTLKTLERKGYVTRSINPEDRRGIIVSITPEGSAYERETRREAEQSIQGLLQMLDGDEATELVRLVEKLSKRAVEASGVAPPPMPQRH